MKNIFQSIIIILSFSLIVIFSCNDVLNSAVSKDPKNSSSSAAFIDGTDIIDFTAVQGKDNREVILTWTNPTNSNFNSVILKRKIGSYPSGYNDSSATTLYTGTNQRYTDSNLTPSNTYYYSIFAKTNDAKYSSAYEANKAITENTTDIMNRSFFIIGGSSNYTTPYSNLVSSVDMYDPLSETMYSNITTLPTPRAFCDVASVSGKIYVFSGYTSTTTITSVVDVFDVSSCTWSTATAMPAVRSALRVGVWNNKIYTIFGTTNTAAATGATGGQIDGRRFDPVANTWLADNNNIYKDLTTQRVNLCAETYDGIIYYWGGAGTGGAITNTGYYYNIYSNTETAITANGNMLYQGAASAMYYKKLDNGSEVAMMFIIGGAQGTSTAIPIPYASLTYPSTSSSVFILPIPFLGGVANWIQLTGNAGNPNDRIYAGAEAYGDCIYLFGGANNTALTSVEKLNVNNGDPNSSSWQLISTTALSPGRFGFGITKVNY